MKRRFGFGKAVIILICVAAFVMLFTFIVMNIWNAVLPAVLGVKVITFWQALGILVLSKILFGGFGGWRHKGDHIRHRWQQRMRDKWEKMTPEEKQKFQEQWKNRCNNWKGHFKDHDFITREPGTGAGTE